MPWPDPGRVLRSLAESFSFAPDRVTLTPTEASAVWVAGVEGGSVTESMPDLELGFVGVVLFRCVEPEIAPKVDVLLRLAPFAGVGTKKHQTLGVTRVTRLDADGLPGLWQRRATRRGP